MRQNFCKHEFVKMCKHCGFEYGDSMDADIVTLAKTNIISAIKLYRERYDVGLREAKEVIDKLVH